MPDLHVLGDPSDDEEPRGTDSSEVAALLGDVRAALARFIVLSDEQLDTLSLWIAHTYVYRQYLVSPYMAIMSPTMRSGKTNLLMVLEQICYEPEVIVHQSTASLYRMIDELRPTLLFDELDQQKLSKSYQGILNSGYKAGTHVSIVVNGRVTRLDTYCPKAFASIGRALSRTLSDRSITLHMRRKLPTEQVDEFSIASLPSATAGLSDRLYNFRANFLPLEIEPEMPELLNDRERELWRPLFHVAARADGWSTRAWNACTVLTEATQFDEVDDSVMLLADIRAAFGARAKLFSDELLKRIRNLDEPQYDGPATQTKKALATALAPYQIHPKQLRIGKENKKGYFASQFRDAFDRYLPPGETAETAGDR